MKKRDIAVLAPTLGFVNLFYLVSIWDSGVGAIAMWMSPEVALLQLKTIVIVAAILIVARWLEA